MRIVMFMASKYGLDCYKAVKEIENVKIAGILTTLPHFVLRYENPYRFWYIYMIM